MIRVLEQLADRVEEAHIFDVRSVMSKNRSYKNNNFIIGVLLSIM